MCRKDAAGAAVETGVDEAIQGTSTSMRWRTQRGGEKKKTLAENAKVADATDGQAQSARQEEHLRTDLSKMLFRFKKMKEKS